MAEMRAPRGTTPGTDYLRRTMENITAHMPIRRSPACIPRPPKNAPISTGPYRPSMFVLLTIIPSKYLDSHLKPYRCKDGQCADAHFSSNACLFRHEREAHGMHGHGENPNLCHFSSCERSIPGNGFPRRWNLRDHMRRVHDYILEGASSPETSPVAGHLSKKKDKPGRKRKSLSAAQTVKRTRAPGSKATQPQPHNGQELEHAERKYYSCKSRFQDVIADLSPHDPTLHERANAALQELLTLGLNYRVIRAALAAGESPVALARQ